MNNKQNIRIRGGQPLSGSIRIVPNKNAILPALAAALLTNEVMTYPNTPRSPDVQKLLLAFRDIGADVDDDTATITICCKKVFKKVISSDIIMDMQAGYLLAAGLLFRFGEATIPIASGCELGYRGPEGHIEYFNEIGVGHELTDTHVRFYLKEKITDDKLVERDALEYIERFVTYTQPKVTPTENVLMLLAVSPRFKTEVSGIAQEPHVRQLIELLRKMGTKIIGKGSTVEITGADNLKGATFIAEPDHIDYFGGVAMAVMTNSNILLEMDGDKIAPGIVVLNKFVTQMGIKFAVEGGNVRVFGSTSTYMPDDTFPKGKIHGRIAYVVKPGPWPAYPVDALGSLIALSTTSINLSTPTLVHNWMYDDGLKYVPAIKAMGAAISFYDEQRVVIDGTESGNPFVNDKASLVDAPNVIEGSRAILYCAMTGGTHSINNAQYILRRNPEFFILHQRLGLDIDIFQPIEDTYAHS